MSIRVAFVDDHPILLEGLVSLYSEKTDLDVVAMGHTAVDAIHIAQDKSPDVIVVDLSMPGDPVEAIDTIIKKNARIRVIVFTASSAIQTAVQLLNTGVAGYVLKGSSSSELHHAITAAHNGETYITPGFATKVIMSMKTQEMRRAAQAQQKLHHREEQIVIGLLQGHTNREIGAELNISEKTVKHYMTSLMQKLHVRNRVELVIAVKNRTLPREAVQ